MLISKKNEVYLTLTGIEDSMSRELTEYFTFDVPGAKFMPMYKNRIWDGKIRLFSPATGEIYVGLLNYVENFCKKNNVEYTIEDGVKNERNIVRKDVTNFIRSLKPKARGKSIKVRDFQIDAVQLAITRNRSLIVCPTASGK